MELKDKVALITGGSSGIGEAIARRFARAGALVAVAGSTNLQKAAVVARGINDQGGHASPFVADLRSVAAVKRLIAEVVGEFGGIDILVNSAGVFFPTPIGKTTEDDFDRMISINLKSVFFAIDQVTSILERRGGGKIVNIASVAAYVGSAQYPFYCAVKAAIVALTRALALQLAPLGININAIAPGNTATPMNEAIRSEPEFAARRATIEALTPSRRKFSLPEDIAAGALFLASEESKSMHGTTMVMDEGRSAGW